MRTGRRSGDRDDLTILDGAQTRVLSAREERSLLGELAECRTKLAEALAQMPNIPEAHGADEPSALSDHLARACVDDGPTGARLGAIHHRYKELRGRLVLANMRLVAHVAKRFRDRGVAYSDLIQDGMCGLLEAIDRFDMGRETKLATYATWWIRQSMQKAVASGAYPVRLSPRHLRQLAQNQEDFGGNGARAETDPTVSAELIRRIHTATRPAVSLDASCDARGDFRLVQTVQSPDGEAIDDVETGEAVGKLMGVLRPREQEVLSLRFGLSGRPGMSLSEVGRMMDVSKERIRQIQDRALEKLRAAAGEQRMTGDFGGV